MIREMVKEDWAQVSAIYAQGIASGISTFNASCPTYEEWDASHCRDCRFVYLIDGQVVAWAALAPVSSRSVYRGCAELSIYADRSCHRKGVGTALVRTLVAEAQRKGYWSLWSSVISTNAASLALHKKCGFREIGYRERVAKDIFGLWQNTTLLELRLKDEET